MKTFSGQEKSLIKYYKIHFKMEIKGTAVKSIAGFVQTNFPQNYPDWYNALSDTSRGIVNSAVTSGWYNMKKGAEEPTKLLGALIYDNDWRKAALESGRYSAEIALNGIYKIYVKISRPGHIIERASRILPAYYQPSKVESYDFQSNSVKVEITDFDEPSEVIEYRIMGWIERALEISGCKGVSVKTRESMAKGSSKTLFICTWQ